MCYKGEEIHGEKRENRQLERERERERERSMRRGEIRVSDSEAVRREKVKGREKKWENLPWERDFMFFTATNKDNIYRRCNVYFGKQPIVDKTYFY